MQHLLHNNILDLNETSPCNIVQIPQTLDNLTKVHADNCHLNNF